MIRINCYLLQEKLPACLGKFPIFCGKKLKGRLAERLYLSTMSKRAVSCAQKQSNGYGMHKTPDFGCGLIGMEARVQALGGQLVLTREPGLGLSVTAHLPIPAHSTRAPADACAGNARKSTAPTASERVS